MSVLDPYLYPHSNVLKNLLAITDQVQFEEAEADYTSLRLREIAQNTLPGSYDVPHYYSFHRYIFQDIFSWAGQPRTINIEKEEPALGGLSVEYAPAKTIESQLTACLQSLQEQNLKIIVRFSAQP